MSNTVQKLIDEMAQRQPDKTFLIIPETGRRMTYKALREHCLDISTKLDTNGISVGDKVGFILPNGYWTTALLLGIIYSGRVAVPLNVVAGDSALSFVIEHSDSKMILVDDGYREKYSTILNAAQKSISIIRTDVDDGPDWKGVSNGDSKRLQTKIDASSDAILIYTSGTTGRPKGVLLSHGNVLAGGRNTALAHELGEEDRAMCVLPLYHINAEMVTVMAPLVSGGSIIMPARFSTSEFWDVIGRYKGTWFSVVPTIVAYLLEHAERMGFDSALHSELTNLRFGRSASAPLSPEMHKAFEDRFEVPLIETMGLSETSAQILSNPMPPKVSKYGSPGLPVGNEAKIIDDHGNDCPAGVSGELMIRGDNVTRGYYKNDEETKKTIEPDGWLHTGDIAMYDDDGFYFITGRIKELIIKGGENIAPREIDEALYEDPTVLEAAGFAIPDDNYGQEVMACVALKPGSKCDEQELLDLVKQKLGAFKSPKRIFILEELPKGPSGKIQRLKLADLVQDQLS